MGKSFPWQTANTSDTPSQQILVMLSSEKGLYKYIYEGINVCVTTKMVSAPSNVHKTHIKYTFGIHLQHLVTCFYVIKIFYLLVSCDFMCFYVLCHCFFAPLHQMNYKFRSVLLLNTYILLRNSWGSKRGLSLNVERVTTRQVPSRFTVSLE